LGPARIGLDPFASGTRFAEDAALSGAGDSNMVHRAASSMLEHRADKRIDMRSLCVN
jgi:hypothetical protein